jgi:hypothetical protein
MEEMKDISMAGLRSMFYMVTPNESSFQHVEEVPKYTSQVGRPPQHSTTAQSGLCSSVLAHWKSALVKKKKKATATPSPKGSTGRPKGSSRLTGRTTGRPEGSPSLVGPLVHWELAGMKPINVKTCVQLAIKNLFIWKGSRTYDTSKQTLVLTLYKSNEITCVLYVRCFLAVGYWRAEGGWRSRVFSLIRAG